MYRLASLLLFSVLAAPGWAQQSHYVAGRCIVRFQDDVDGKAWAHQRPEVTRWRRLNETLNTYLLHVRGAADSLQRLYAADPAVRAAQLDHRLSLRGRSPNDPRYDRQWQFLNTGQDNRPEGNDYNAEEAWAVTTGGVTPNGDTIVIASIDNGVDLDHEDLVANHWINHNEIPANGIDDDDNGYVDDYYGWNTALDNADVEAGGGNHGTPVMGQLAARGDNGRGVTGMNWAVKVMHITNDFDPTESEVIQAYGYALEARRRYDATDGREGAYVVATNASWGRDRAFPGESPIWCALYDTLGRHGIINVAAVPNRDLDVDVVGDLPALCDSEFLIVTTSIDDRNQREGVAASGRFSVDLGAYGEDVYTTLLGNGYGSRSGTSFAAPAVTGALALLHSAPCPGLGGVLRSDPVAAIREVRDAILDNTRPQPQLAGVTTSGGALDVGAAMDAIMKDCDDCLAPTSFAATADERALVLDWRIADGNGVTLRYRPTDATAGWKEIEVTAPYRLTDLPGCTDYALQLVADCGAATDTLFVETPGCCRLPDAFTTDALAGGRILAQWQPELEAESYTLRYRTGDGGPWKEITTTETRLSIDGLRSCRSYTLEIKTNCGGGGGTDFGRARGVKTLGCGVCLDAVYCRPTGFANEQEWIASVRLPGVLVNESGRESDAYANFGDLTTAAMVPGGVYPIELTAGFRGGNGFTEDFHVYVDWNQDGTFGERELAVETAGQGRGAVGGSIVVPEDAPLGLTRMRIIMQFTAVTTDGCPAGPARRFSGEVEDYCLDITSARGCPPPDRLTASYDEDGNASSLHWDASAAPGGEYLIRYRPRGEGNYTEIRVTGLDLTIDDIDLCSSYEVQVASVCASDSIGPYRTIFLGDDCVYTRDERIADRAWSVAPNPAATFTTVGWSARIDAAELTLTTIDGRRIGRYFLEGDNHHFSLPLANLPPGVYIVRLLDTRGRQGVRRLVVH